MQPTVFILVLGNKMVTEGVIHEKTLVSRGSMDKCSDKVLIKPGGTGASSRSMRSSVSTLITETFALHRCPVQQQNIGFLAAALSEASRILVPTHSLCWHGDCPELSQQPVGHNRLFSVIKSWAQKKMY